MRHEGGASTLAFSLNRPGGGGSFRGGSSSSGGSRSGSSSSSSSSSGGFHPSSSSGYSPASSSGGYAGGSSGGSALGALFILPVVFFIVILLVILASRRRNAQSWATRAPVMQTPYEPPEELRVSPRKELQGLTDPSFSLVLFDDFLVALYTEIKIAQGKGQLARYQPYLAPTAMQTLTPPGAEITSVVVGSATIDEVNADPQRVWVEVDFETNYAVGHGGMYTSERWTFARNRTAKSRAPKNARLIGCPNCGAPLDVIAAGVCSHCRANVTGGAFDWVVERIAVQAQEPRGPMLTSNVEEEGTEEETVKDPGANAAFHALTVDDPGTSWQALSARVGLTFGEFQTAWAARDLVRMRPLMSDSLFATQTYWVEEYKRQHLRNITENAQIASLELASVTRDAFYDAVTIRVYASSLDYTVSDANNQIVSGNRSRPRSYTEYWTMIRGRGAKGPPRMEKVCPNCGAPLDVTMAGDCKYCKVKVTTGQFDWVLSRIEQDEVYRG